MFCISDNNDSCIGLKLSGVDGVVVHTRDELEAAVEMIAARSDIGLVLFTPKVREIDPQYINESFGGKGKPLFYEIPDRHSKNHADSIREYLKTSVGLEI